jgi:hypothetical protein
MTGPNIIRAIEKVFAPCFDDLSTWFNWTVILKAIFGLPMNRKERRAFEKIACRKAPEHEVKEVYVIAGRRGGKSFIVALIAVFLAVFFNYRPYLRIGERGVIQIVAVERANRTKHGHRR